MRRSSTATMLAASLALSGVMTSAVSAMRVAAMPQEAPKQDPPKHDPPPPPNVPPGVSPPWGGWPDQSKQDVPAGIGTRPSIAILPVEAALPRYVFGIGPTSPDGDCGSVERPGADLARRATQELIESMVATQRFRVVDRDTIERVLQEQNFHRTQGVAPTELARLGRLLGADRLVITSLDLAGTSCRRVEVRASGYLAFEFGGGIEMVYRVVDVATGEISTMGRLTRTWDSRQNPELRAVLASPEGASNFFIRQAISAETFAVLDAIDPVKVAAIQDGVVILNQGRGRPMVTGLTLRVMLKGDPVIDPDTGAVLGDEGGEAALIQVVSVEEKLSRARIVVGDASRIAIGARCRTIDVPPRPQ